MNKILTVLAALSVWTAFGANTWYVDDDNYGKSGMTGATEALAYGTIQEALDAETTLPGDTVMVLPGTYDKDAPQGQCATSRVLLKKNVTLCSRDGAAATHVVGKRAATTYGYGEGAMRCLEIRTAEIMCRPSITGFTFRDGATADKESGGGVFSESADWPGFVTDCVISNCAAYNAGGAFNCYLTRTLIAGNYAYNTGAACRYCALSGSVVANNFGSTEGIDALGDCYAIIHTTICNNRTRAICGPKKPIRNSLFCGNAKGDTMGTPCGELYNCVTESPADAFASVTDCKNGVVTPMLVDPEHGDYRLITGCAATNVADGAQQALTDSWFRQRNLEKYDFNNTFLPTSGKYHAGAVQQTVAVSDTWYVDDDNYGKSGDGLTEETAFGTIQEALDAETTRSGHTVIVLPGTYDKDVPGSTEPPSGRVILQKNVTLRSRDGAAVTHVVGKRAATTYGYGAGAMRCLEIRTKAIAARPSIVGFTFRDGATTAEDGASGGGIYSESFDFPGFVTDCVISNCAAYNAGGAINCVLTRTLVAGNYAYNTGAACRSCMLASSIVANNFGSTTGIDALANCYEIIHTTICNNRAWAIYKPNAPIRNSLFCGNTKGENSSNAYGELYNCVTESPAEAFKSVSGCQNGVTTPTVVDPANGDYRLIAGCAAIGVADAAQQALADSWFRTRDFEKYDFNRAPLPAEGKYNAGAVQESAVIRVCTVSVSGGGVAVTGGQEGTNILKPGDSITFAPAKTGSRPCAGIVVNGANVWFRDHPTYTLTFEMLEGMSGATVEALYTNDWYVDAVNGDDGNSGYWQGAAFKTLTNAVNKAVSGDTVHALPGVYEEGESQQIGSVFGSDSVHLCRVALKAGVSLVADEGPEVTVIKGAPDPEDTEHGGCGPNAVRCVFMRQDTKVSGFTLTGGYSDSGTTKTDRNCGGAVLGWGVNSSIVENCIVSNNVANRAAAGAYCAFDRCRIVGNTVLGVQIAYRVALSNCLWDDNDAARQLGDFYSCVNCTFGRNMRHTWSTNLPELFYFTEMDSDYVISNCFFYYVSPAGSSAATYDHCAFHYTKVPNAICVDCIATNLDALAVVDEEKKDYRPVFGSNLVIDGGNNASCGGLGGLDLAGNPRTMNGTIDIGCYEADWRPRYSADLGHNVTVTDVSPSAYESEARTVILPEGTLTASLKKEGGYCADAKVSGAGVLVVKVGETEIGRVTAAGSGTLRFAANEGDVLSFAFTPGDGGGSAEIGRVRREIGAMLLIR